MIRRVGHRGRDNRNRLAATAGTPPRSQSKEKRLAGRVGNTFHLHARIGHRRGFDAIKLYRYRVHKRQLTSLVRTPGWTGSRVWLTDVASSRPDTSFKTTVMGTGLYPAIRLPRTAILYADDVPSVRRCGSGRACGVSVSTKTSTGGQKRSGIRWKPLKKLVGASGFEPPTSWSRTMISRRIHNLEVGTTIALHSQSVLVFMH